ncbi:hypothetical protein I302_102983 [Kwoniella bestiolae CBS 10118]|uniref:Uncharacterized protein n=1 Tax=Kwoniella bestiolae CBS 10118 TaxID=1296100 RepID=A0AAJ8K581_9TREE
MSPSPDGRKRPRPTDKADERDVKRSKNIDGQGDTMTMQVDGNHKEWVTEQMNRMEKLYKEVLIQSALVFQHQSFCKRLGQTQQKVPKHMMDRLETTWRTYEGLRRHTEWIMAQSGDQPIKSPLSTTSKPSSTLEAITRLASNPLPPNTLELPTPINLSIIGEYVPISTSVVPDKEDTSAAKVIPDKSVVEDIPIPKVEEQPEPSAQPDTNVISGPSEIKKEIEQPQLQAQPAEIPITQTGLVQPPPPVQQPQPQPPQIPTETEIQPLDAGNIDYSTLGLDELTALINGDGSAASFDNSGIPTNDQQSNTNNEIFASLGLDTAIAPSQQQPAQTMELDFAQALNTGAGGLDGEADFSALAGLFANDQPSIPQMTEGGENGGMNMNIEGLEGLLGDTSNTTSEQPTVDIKQNLQGDQAQSQSQLQPQDQTSDHQTDLAVPNNEQINHQISQPSIPPDPQPQPEAQPTTENTVPAPAPPPKQTQTQRQTQVQSDQPESNQQQQESQQQQQEAAPPPLTSQPQSNTLPEQSLQPPVDQSFFQPDFSLPDPTNQAQTQNQNQEFNLDVSAGGGEFGEIDMSDFNFTDAGLEGMGMGGDEFERLMAEFG